jgi:hypothetical protein
LGVRPLGKGSSREIGGELLISSIAAIIPGEVISSDVSELIGAATLSWWNVVYHDKFRGEVHYGECMYGYSQP